jgi:RimK family alpha-L-glutamate ligase
VFCVGDKVIGAMKRSSTDGDFRANITRGGVGDAYEVTPEIEQIALSTMHCLGLTVGGIDLLFDKQSFKVCEANSAPGWIGFQEATGIDVATHLVEFVKESI